MYQNIVFNDDDTVKSVQGTTVEDCIFARRTRFEKPKDFLKWIDSLDNELFCWLWPNVVPYLKYFSNARLTTDLDYVNYVRLVIRRRPYLWGNDQIKDVMDLVWRGSQMEVFKLLIESVGPGHEYDIITIASILQRFELGEEREKVFVIFLKQTWHLPELPRAHTAKLLWLFPVKQRLSVLLCVQKKLQTRIQFSEKDCRTLELDKAALAFYHSVPKRRWVRKSGLLNDPAGQEALLKELGLAHLEVRARRAAENTIDLSHDDSNEVEEKQEKEAKESKEEKRPKELLKRKPDKEADENEGQNERERKRPKCANAKDKQSIIAKDQQCDDSTPDKLCCKVCEANEVATLALPCRHATLCFKCLDEMKKLKTHKQCIRCAQKVTRFISILF